MSAPQVDVSPAAEKFMRRMVRLSGQPGAGFRLHLSAGGCSSLATGFSIEAQPRADDLALSVNGLRLFVGADSAALLDGATVDFADSPTETGLVVRQPGAAACGCGAAGPARAPAVATVSLSSLRRR